jgi:ubiquinone biosynthesis protein
VAGLAARLRPAFERLGTTFIKLGQLIGSADGMLPELLVAEFKQCRDRVPPESFRHVRKVIEQDLGRPLEELFAELDPTPVAAASIAQVHVARLHTGEEVVVKVQRPNIDRIVPRDIATMAWLAPLIEKRGQLAALANLGAYVELFAETIVEELDFRLEAQNMLDVAAVLALTDPRSVVVPRPHPELVSRRVLVMERLHGHSTDDGAALLAAGIDPAPVFRALMVSFLEGAMIHGVFHGDLHGGNMMVGPGGRPAIFDFGITGRFTDAKRLALLGLMVTATTQDGVAMLGHLRDLGGLPPGADVDDLAKELDLDGLLAMDPDLSPEAMGLQMRETMQRLVAHGAKLPKEMFLYIKGMVYLNGAVSSVAADVDMFEEMTHLYELFTTTHSEVMAEFVDLDALPGAEALTDTLRRQVGGRGDERTYRELQEAQAERTSAMRDALRGP